MPRVKRSVAARKKRRKVLDEAKGFVGQPHVSYRKAKEQLLHADNHAYRDRRNKKRDVPPALDPAYQRGRTEGRALVQPVHLRPAEGRDRARSQGARRPRGERPGRLHEGRGAGQGRARGLSTAEPESLPDVFRRLAADFERGGSPLYARLAREHAEDPVLVEICADRQPRWEAPLRVLAAIHYLVLSGRAPDAWNSFAETLRTHREWVSRFVAEQPIQTNEVQRCWALLPAFLTVVDDRPADLVELGPSAGLNLLWDRYAYRYGTARWGPEDAPLALAGEAGGGLPAELFESNVTVRTRLGIDRHPVDATSEEGALLLQAFVWADQRDRLERLRRAIDIVRRDPPRLIRGDYADELPAVLADRDLDVLTVVFHSVSLGYLAREARDRVRAAIDAEGERGALAHVSYEFVEDEPEGFESFALDVTTYPGGEAKRLARLDGHANRLSWVA